MAYILPHCVNTIIAQSKEEGIKSTTLKIQKLLYLWYVSYLYHNPRDALFAERFEVWQTGPGIYSVYKCFKKYKDKPIRKYCYDFNGEISSYELTPSKIHQSFFEMWNKFKYYTGIELSRIITQKRNCAWYCAAARGNLFLNDAEIISDYGRYF